MVAIFQCFLGLVLMTIKFTICETVTLVHIVFNIALLLWILIVIEQLSVTSHMWKPRPLHLNHFSFHISPLKPFT